MRLKFTRQFDQMDCGPACIRMVASAYGKDYPLSYLRSLKLNQSAEAAMNQINLKDYPSRFALSGLPIIKVGINFDMEKHSLKDWMIE